MASPSLPVVYQVVSAFKAQLLREERDAQRRMVAAWRRVETELQADIEAMAYRLENYRREGQAIRESTVIRMASREGLLQKARAEIIEYSDTVAEPETLAAQERATRTGVQQAQTAIDSAADARIAFDRLSPNALESAVGVAGDGSPLRDTLLNRYAYNGVDGIVGELVTGVGVGRGPREMARRAVRNGLSQSLNHMLVVMRTETLRAYRTSSMEQYKHSGVVSAYKRLATRDSRVCLGCLLDDGNIYQVGEVMPEHPNGRCAMVPIVDGSRPAEWQNGPAWFASQPESTQIAIMGPGRHEAWQAGQFSLEDAVKITPNDVWGASIGPKPLRELV